jgi:hypothetical protein
VNGVSRESQFFADLRVVNLALDLELHFTFQHSDQLVGGVPEVFPMLARRVSPQFAVEAT